jgi:hypothetical protein
VPRWLKALIWIAVFAACAGAGAYVAAHTDPFPPGVDDPGARGTPSTTGSPSATPSIERWRITVRGSAVHTFRVGGACTSSWSGSARFPVDGAEVVAHARLELTGDGSCDFPVAQVQAERLDVELVTTDDDEAQFRVIGRTPPGSEDLGGFASVIVQQRFSLAPDTGSGAQSELSDGKGGTIQGSVRIAVRCLTGCG